MFWLFGHEAYGSLAPQPGIEPAPPALEGNVLTTGPSGKSRNDTFFKCDISHMINTGNHSYDLQK